MPGRVACRAAACGSRPHPKSLSPSPLLCMGRHLKWSRSEGRNQCGRLAQLVRAHP